MLIFHVPAHVPAPTTFVTTAIISKAKTWTYKGKKQSLLYASSTGSLYARGEFAFADGTKGSGSVVRPCTPKG